MKKRLIGICLIGAIAFSGLSTAKVNAAKSQSQVEKENEELKEQLDTLNNDVEALDSRLEKATNKFDKRTRKLKKLQKTVADTQKSLKNTIASRKKQYRIMNKRVKFLYENGATAYIDTLLESKSFGDFFERLEYVTQISEYDSTMFAELERTEAKIKRDAKEIKEREKEAVVAANKARANKEEVEKLIAEKKTKIEDFEKKITDNDKLIEQYEQESSGDYDLNTSSEEKGTLLWPVPSLHKVTSPFGMRYHPTLKKNQLHNGIDIPCGTGTTVVAAADGTVTASESKATNGQYIAIRHSGGLTTMYLHCSKRLVKVGENVKRGQTIAKSGATGRVTGPHLHFIVQKDGTYVNPMNYF